MSRPNWLIVATTTVLPLLYVLVWVWVLVLPNPLQHFLADWPVWPVACTTRGCVTSASWLTTHQQQVQFAEALGQETPTLAQSLTTTVRVLLLRQSQIRSPITHEDAQRYRNEILHLNDSEVTSVSGVAVDEYDASILVPFLTQEYARQQMQAESNEELYHQLSNERFLILLPIYFHWDKDQGRVYS